VRKVLSSRFLRNIAALQAGGIVYAGMNFASAFALAHVLGASRQGSWIVANQLYALAFFVVNLGLLQVAVTQIAAGSARGQFDKVGAWLACLVKVYLLMGVGLVTLGWVLLPPAVAWWRGINPTIDPRVATWAWCLLWTPILDIPRVAVVAAFQGTRRMVRLTQVENAAEVLRSFLVIAGAILTGSPWGPVAGSLAGTVLASLIAVALYRRANKESGSYPLPGVRAILGGIRGVPIRAAFRDGLKFGIVRQSDALGRKILPPLIVQTFGTSSWVTYLRFAQLLMDLPLLFMQGVGRTALPALAELRGLKDHRLFRRLFLRATLLGGGLIGLGVLLFLPVVPHVLRVFPADYRDPIWTLCLILTLNAIPVGFTITLDSFYLLTGQLRIAVRLSVLCFLSTVATMLFLSGPLPRTGAAWGLVFMGSFSFIHLSYIWWYFRHDPELAAARRAEREAVA
jgi:O-antigen/teichoic acid export membrane protein